MWNTVRLVPKLRNRTLLPCFPGEIMRGCKIHAAFLSGFQTGRFIRCSSRRSQHPTFTSPPACRTRHFVILGAPRITKWRALDSQIAICQRLPMEKTASNFKLRSNATGGESDPKAISYQPCACNGASRTRGVVNTRRAAMSALCVSAKCP
jgi:hypothetical protein